MVKRYLSLIAVFLGLSGCAFAADRQIQPDFVWTTTGAVTVISASAWTALPRSSTQTLEFTSPAFWVDHQPNDTQNVLIAITTSPVAPGTTTHGFVYEPSNPPWIVSVDRALYFWAIADGQPQRLFTQDFQ